MAGKIALIIILLAGAFLRLYRISDYMTFLGDEGRDAIVVRDILLGKNFPLIGPGTSVGNMYLGPWYYYLIAPSLLFSNFSPVGPAVFIAIIGLLTIGLLWWVCREWGLNQTVSLVVSTLYAVSPVVINYSRSSWNPNIMPFFALLCIYGIWRVWLKSDWKWIFVIAISFAFVLNSHYLGLLLTPTISLFILFSKKIKKNLFLLFISIFSFFILISPLVLFDAAHNWTNFNALKTFFAVRQQTINLQPQKSLPNLWPIWTDLNTTLLTSSQKQMGLLYTVIISLSLSLTLIRQIKNKTFSKELILVLSWLGFGILGLGLYKQHIYAHYYGFMFPAPFLLIGILLKQSNKPIRSLGVGGLLFLIIISFINNPFRFEPNRQLSRTRQIADFIIHQSSGQPFNLALLSKYNYDASYRYLLDLNHAAYVPIQEQNTGQLFVICEGEPSRPELAEGCEPINNPRYEIAAFGWAKIDQEWSFPWQVKVYKLIPNPSGV